MMLCIINRIIKKPVIGGVLINLNRSKSFDSVKHRYMEAVPRAAGLTPYCAAGSLPYTVESTRELA